jgi:hypothetical protein
LAKGVLTGGTGAYDRHRYLARRFFISVITGGAVSLLIHITLKKKVLS